MFDSLRLSIDVRKWIKVSSGRRWQRISFETKWWIMWPTLLLKDFRNDFFHERNGIKMLTSQRSRAEDRNINSTGIIDTNIFLSSAHGYNSYSRLFRSLPYLDVFIFLFSHFVLDTGKIYNSSLCLSPSPPDSHAHEEVLCAFHNHIRRYWTSVEW